MARLYLLLFVINVALAVAALISCLSAEEPEIRVLPRIGWILIILLFSPIGPIAWFLAGRERPAARSGRRAGGPPARPVATDDDPEFLRSLGDRDRDRERRETDREADAELLRRWEADLRRREDELRRPGDEPPEPPPAQP